MAQLAATVAPSWQKQWPALMTRVEGLLSTYVDMRVVVLVLDTNFKPTICKMQVVTQWRPMWTSGCPLTHESMALVLRYAVDGHQGGTVQRKL